MKILYFIGSSGSGKSTICEELSRDDSNIEHEKLDNIYKKYKLDQGSHHLAVKKTIEKLTEIEHLNGDRIYLIDAGSFAQKYLDISLWEKRRSRLVCFKNDINVCFENYKKRSSKRMDFERWKRSEFNSERERLYSLADHSIDITNLDIPTTKQQVLEIISQLDTVKPLKLNAKKNRLYGSFLRKVVIRLFQVFFL